MTVKSLLKIVGCLVVIASAYGFANHRFNARTVSNVNISFTDDKALFISENNVNKLLIQNYDTITSVPLEKLDLNKSELQLVENAIIRGAEVSVSLDGQLQAVVEQRQPIARIMGGINKYLDADNKLMPLSKEHTAHVPLIYGYQEKYQQAIFDFLVHINDDKLLKTAITQIKLNKKGEATLMVRAHNYSVRFGFLEELPHKLMNYKAFIAKMKKDNRLEEVKTIDLRYKNQVVSIKK